MTSNPPEKLVIIDGNSLLYRAFYALPPLQNRRGEHTNAVYGFTTMLLKLLEEEKPDYIAVAFDPPRPSFRVRIDPSYKAQREKTPQELGEQVRRTRQVLEAMGIAVFEVDDFEADDVIGTLSDRFKGDNREVAVVSGDADLLQLVAENVTVVMTKKGITRMESYDPARLREDYGLKPEQVIDYKALKGDSSDNIPGVPGIGEKTARRLIEAYGTIENIYANLDELKKRTASSLKEHREALNTGRDLVTLRRNVPFDLNWEQCRHGEPDREKLLEIFTELEFKSLVKKFENNRPEEEPLPEQAGPGQQEAVESMDLLKSLLEPLREGDMLALDLEFDSGRPYWTQPLKVIAFSPCPGNDTGNSRGYYLDPQNPATGQEEILKVLFECSSRGVLYIVHNVKKWFHLFNAAGPELSTFAFDTYLAAYLCDPARGGYDLPDLFHHYLGLDFFPGGEKNRDPGLEQTGRILAARAASLPALKDCLREELREQGLGDLLRELEMPLAAVLCRMEQRGIGIDRAYLEELFIEITGRLGDLEQKIYTLAGQEFNINSPRQLSTILFDKLQLPEIRKTKTGRSTDAGVLEELAYQHEIAALLLHYRQLSKLQGTYLAGLIELVDEKKKRLYTNFNQAATATGRLSSSDPNLQNIPVRLEEGRRIRRAFVPSAENRIFFAADYSQVELRILAHLSRDPILVEAFETGQDIHTRTASEVNSTTIEEVTPQMRDKAKAVNFGIIYGSSDYGLAKGLKIPRSEARAYMDSYFERYSGVKRYMKEIVRQAREQGYVTTILNRRRYLPEINSSHHNQRSFAERMALNTPIQGSAADVIKLAMLKIDRIIEEGGFRAAMLLQIHDELLFEIEAEDLDFFAPIVRREMEQAYTLGVPLQVDLKWGPSWDELKPME